MLLSPKKIILRNSLQNKILLFNITIEPGFYFNPITKKENPKEYFVAAVLHKIYSINISIENCLLANDIFLSVYIYRYVYELYIKTLYIFSGKS